VSAGLLDPVVGMCFCLLGVGGWRRLRVAGLLAIATGVLWFLGGLAGPLVLAHRGPLTHLLVGYPRGRLRDRVEQIVVVIAYADALIYPVGRSAAITLVFASVVAVVMARGYRRARGAERRMRLVPLTSSVAVWGALGFGAAARLTDRHVDAQVLMVYEVMLVATAVVMFVDSRYGRWQRSAITSLAVELGHARSFTMRDRLADALGDPSLVFAYTDPVSGGMRDESGRAVALTTQLPGRTVTVVDDAGRPIAALVHETAVLDDPVLLDSVSSLAKIALANARMQQEVQARFAAVEESRRRLLSVADAERDRLEAELRAGTQCRLERVARLVEDVPGCAEELARQVAASQDAIRQFARGVHPRVLTEDGLGAALADLAAMAPIPLTVAVPGGRFETDVEVAAYFVCAEALTNVAKYAHATQARVSITVGRGGLMLDVSDDDPARGSGLVGLRDRLDVLGGTLEVSSPAGRGTRLVARIPARSHLPE
jgi:signal transduction histidine kinase